MIRRLADNTLSLCEAFASTMALANADGETKHADDYWKANVSRLAAARGLADRKRKQNYKKKKL